MIHLHLKDNSQRDIEGLKKAEFDKLENITGKSIKDILSENEALTYIPFELKNSDLNNDVLFDVDTNKILKTYNIMGFIGFDNVQITIGSRFDTNTGQNYFLQYLLSKVFAINLNDLTTSAGNDNIWNFLLYLIFYNQLNKALRQGIFKTYIKKSYNNPQIKGSINIARHLKQNLPFRGNIAYDTKEFSYDNDLTQLIRHAIEFIISKGFDAINSNIFNDIKLMREVTPSYSQTTRLDVIKQNYRPVHHPYFTEYEALRILALKILGHKTLSYHQNNNEVYGILIDGAWLWEAYLHTILKNLTFKHPENDKGTGRVYMFKGYGGHLYPDFYSVKKQLVIDAKYKHLHRSIDNKDLQQMVTYLHILQIPEGLFLYPDKENSGVHNSRILNGLGGKIGVYAFKVPQKTENYKDFMGLMQQSETRLETYLKNLNLENRTNFTIVASSIEKYL